MYPRAVRLFLFLTSVLSVVSIASWSLPQGETSSTSNSRIKKAKKEKAPSETSNQNVSKKSPKLDLNTATKEQLDALPGIGDAYAQKIVEGRPYKSKSDLVRKGILASSAYDKIKDQVTAQRSSKSETSEENPTGSAVATSPKPSAAQSANRSTKSSNSQTEPEATTAQTPPEKGMVWVNLDSGIYHREGDRWYGKTKKGKFMSESDAQKAGYRASKSGQSKDAEKE